MVLNFFGVKGYGEAEFVFAIVKVTAIIGYIILAVIINVAGGPNGDYIGFKLWHNPGAFHNGFKGLCSTFVTAAFAFGGTELVGLAAAETENPRKALPTAIKQVRSLAREILSTTNLCRSFGESPSSTSFLSSWLARLSLTTILVS